MITQEKYIEICKKGYSLDIIYLLQLISKEEINFELLSNVKIETIIKTIVRKGLLSEDYKITISGKELLEFINSNSVCLPKTKKENNFFDLWWEAYPANNKLECKGISFEATRSFRLKKEDCKKKFNAILNEGEYSPEQLINALKYEVSKKKEESFEKKENKLTYLQNSFTYLNQRSYEGFIDMVILESEINEEDKIINIKEMFE